ncbi:MAG: DUF4112 domain-containing protein [Bacteroidales bacterium]|nr:DUF4112 domain-containing protein [Bacteroidales bacterium]MBQ5575069.1 DUF4112 domain-containing protein [Bacteroidales bacterium]
MECKRRTIARENLGFESEIEKAKMERALAKEEKRREKKELAREKLENDWMYRTVKGISFLMDKCFVDAVLGFIVPGVGDFLTIVLSFPFLFVALFKIRSIPLFLAVLYNIVLDCFIGLTPYIGDVLDVFYRSYTKNYRLIVGFVENDGDVIDEVRRSAWKSAILIVILGVACYFLYLAVKGLYLSIAALLGCN